MVMAMVLATMYSQSQLNFFTAPCLFVIRLLYIHLGLAILYSLPYPIHQDANMGSHFVIYYLANILNVCFSSYICNMFQEPYNVS